MEWSQKFHFVRSTSYRQGLYRVCDFTGSPTVSHGDNAVKTPPIIFFSRWCLRQCMYRFFSGLFCLVTLTLNFHSQLLTLTLYSSLQPSFTHVRSRIWSSNCNCTSLCSCCRIIVLSVRTMPQGGLPLQQQEADKLCHHQAPIQGVVLLNWRTKLGMETLSLYM